MIKRFFIVFFRNLRRQKGYGSLNLIGLSMGIACSLLIFSWILYELSYDNFHQNKDELYLVIQHQNFQKGVVNVLNTTPPRHCRAPGKRLP